MRGRMQNFASSRSICPVIAAAFLTLSNVSAANAQALDFVRNLFNRDKADEVKKVETVVDEESASASPCPETVAFFEFAQNWPESCGTVVPPNVSGAPEGGTAALEGVWEIEVRTKDGPLRWVGALNKGLAHVGARTPDAPWNFIGNLTGPIDEPKLPFIGDTFSVTPEAVSGAGVKVSLGGYEITVSPAGAANMMTGRWRRRDETGVVIWRKRPPASVRSVRFYSNFKDADGEDVVDEIAMGSRPARIEARHVVGCGYGHMRGNCHRVYVTIYGSGLEGPHEVWLDPNSHMELLERRYIFQDDNTFPASSAMGWIVSSRRSVKGIQLQFALWDGARPGPQILWFDGRPIPFDFIIHGYPDEKEEKKPSLLTLEAWAAEGAPVTQVEEGAPFRLTAKYDGEYPDPWVAVDAPGLPRIDAGGRLEPQTIILQRTDDPRILQSRLLKVEKTEFYPVVDEPLGEEEGADP